MHNAQGNAMHPLLTKPLLAALHTHARQHYCALPFQIVQPSNNSMVSWAGSKLLELLCSLLQACYAGLQLRKLLFTVAPKAQQKLMEKAGDWLHQLYPTVWLPHVTILCLQ